MRSSVKKFISGVMLALAVAFSFSLPTFAASGGKTSSNMPSVWAGGTAEITIRIENCDEVNSGGISIDSMSEELELMQKDTKWLVEDAVIKDVDYAKRHAVFACSENTDINGNVFRIAVRVSEEAQLGKKAIEYTFKFKNDDKEDFSVSGEAFVEVVGANGERASGCGALLSVSRTSMALSAAAAALLLKKKEKNR